MSTLTIRLPDDKHERLKAVAKSRAISVNKLIDELATVALAN
jgi:predicted HicB family RNase H-like nuclease